jgi:uncharacterized membrane protein
MYFGLVTKVALRITGIIKEKHMCEDKYKQRAKVRGLSGVGALFFFAIVVLVVVVSFPVFKNLSRQRLQTRSSLHSGMRGSAPEEFLEEDTYT